MIFLIACYLLCWASCRAALRGEIKYVEINVASYLVSCVSVLCVTIHEIKLGRSLGFGTFMLLAFLLTTLFNDLTDEYVEKFALLLFCQIALCLLIIWNMIFH